MYIQCITCILHKFKLCYVCLQCTCTCIDEYLSACSFCPIVYISIWKTGHGYILPLIHGVHVHVHVLLYSTLYMYMYTCMYTTLFTPFLPSLLNTHTHTHTHTHIVLLSHLDVSHSDASSDDEEQDGVAKTSHGGEAKGVGESPPDKSNTSTSAREQVAGK